VIETQNVVVLVEFIASICPPVTVQNSSSTLPLIFALLDWAVHETDVPSPMTSHAEPSLTTRICVHCGPKLVDGTLVVLPP
jgi:hypothetical protein